MKKYGVVFNCWQEVIEVEDFENEQDALDKLIDKLEKEGSEGCFLTENEIAENGGEYQEDMYIIGGNHGRILYHNGNFRIFKWID